MNAIVGSRLRERSGKTIGLLCTSTLPSPGLLGFMQERTSDNFIPNIDISNSHPKTVYSASAASTESSNVTAFGPS